MREDRVGGLTTTIPVEAVFAAGLVPLDLNNVFVGSERSEELVDFALAEGFPQNSCAWIKGIYGAVLVLGRPSRVIGVVRGDCSGTELLLEAFAERGIDVVPFTYPYPASRVDLEREISLLCSRLDTTLDEAEVWRGRLARPRELLVELDRACWEADKVTGAEAHVWLVSASDFGGEPEGFGRELSSFLAAAESRSSLAERDGIPFAREVRLGYIGVPPITPEVFEVAEAAGARFVFHEVARQFSMPPDATGAVRPARDLVEQYSAYTYPYTVADRARDINHQSDVRALDGVVHYVQSFCHRNLEDVVFRRSIERPMLTVECDCPGTLGATSRARLENFIQVLGENQ